MIKQEEFFEYLRTFFITLLCVVISVIITLFVIQHQIYEENAHAKVEDDSIDYYLINVMIDKNKYLETQSPSDYEINLKLGTLYEIKKDYKNAEIEYKKAIDKAPYNEYKPRYKLAFLYWVANRLDDAETVMDNINEEPDKTLIRYKADIYEKLGEKYYNSADYENAIDRYKKSLFYWKILENKKEIDYVQDSLASSYVYLAEAYVDNMRPQDAVSSLQWALSIVDAPILKYKLALLLMKDNPTLANKYFEEVFARAPELINYEAYYQFLSVMAAQANAVGDTAQAQLYRYKQKKVNEYFKVNILSINDIVLEDIEGRITQNNWFKKNDIYLEAKLKNVSKYNIDSLFMEIIFKDENKVIGDYFKQIIYKATPLKPYTYSPLVSIKISQPMDNSQNNNPKIITADIYVSKTEDSLKLHLATVDIKEKVKKKHPNKFFKWFGMLFEKITSKLPSFMF